MIEVYQRPLPDTRTPTLACKWQATCSVMGKTYVEASRAGCTHELARTLVNAGTPHGAMAIHTEGRAGTMTVSSIHEWARWTYSGDKRVLYEVAQANLERLHARKEAA